MIKRAANRLKCPPDGLACLFGPLGALASVMPLHGSKKRVCLSGLLSGGLGDLFPLPCRSFQGAARLRLYLESLVTTDTTLKLKGKNTLKTGNL